MKEVKNGKLFIVGKEKIVRKELIAKPKNEEKPPFETTTLWDFPKQSYGVMPKGNNKFQGVTPAFIIWNMIERYTKLGDLVVDPMVGSGTTIDVCKEENRKVIGYDIHPTRKDVIKNDARKIPLKDNSVDMVFIDSPYGDNVNYGSDPKDIGKISAEDDKFYNELDKVAQEIYRILKPGKVVGWLIGDQWVKRKFTPVGFKIYTMLDKYFEPVDLICVTRQNQSSNTGIWHYRARKFNFFLRGFKHLIIMRKPEEKIERTTGKSKVSWKKYK
jgi:DNA modification methylase